MDVTRPGVLAKAAEMFYEHMVNVADAYRRGLGDEATDHENWLDEVDSVLIWTDGRGLMVTLKGLVDGSERELHLDREAVAMTIEEAEEHGKSQARARVRARDAYSLRLLDKARDKADRLRAQLEKAEAEAAAIAAEIKGGTP